MPYDKLVDSTFLDSGLKQIADSIRAKTGTEDELAFPTGMSEAIDGISGGDTESYAFTDFSNFFTQNARLELLDKIDTSNSTNFYAMFSNCSNLTTIPELDTHNGTDFASMFNTCIKLTTIPELDTSNGKRVNHMFYNCSNLTTIPELNTANSTSFNSMFYNCSNLTTIPRLDMAKGGDVSLMFTGCKSLTDLYLYNIRNTIVIGSGTNYGHLLTVDSLVHTIKELCTVTSTQRLTMGAANLEKITNLYCRVIDDTTKKIEMELCESTDEGAMTLSEYASLKNWTFA